MPNKPTIRELEQILDSEEDTPIEILPNGEIRAQGKGASEMAGGKPITMREDLGGEYGMDLMRVRREVAQAQQHFSYIECHPSSDGSLYVLAALQTPAKMYTLSVVFPDTYPNTLPTVHVRKPALQANAPHRYNSGNICYLHPSMWNPGRHTLAFVIARAAKWLNKYEVWLVTGVWPGAEIKH